MTTRGTGDTAAAFGLKLSRRFDWLRRPLGGIAAVGVKELRGRMRGRRAFVNLTLYLALLTGFSWMVEQIGERSVSSGFGGGTVASAVIGQNIFVALLLLETLLVLVLTPGYTAGAVSLEREKQTLDLLAATPISSLAIVLGKLLSALTYVFLLIFASVPLTAMVFVFGGVSPDDLIRGYVVLAVTAVGMGSVGLFASTLFKRTQGATVVTYALVLALTLGGGFLWVFWAAMSPPVVSTLDSQGGPVPAPAPFPGQPVDVSPQVVQEPARPPEAILWLNPFVADADVLCGTETGFGGTWCGIIRGVTGQPAFDPRFGVGVGGAIAVPPMGGKPFQGKLQQPVPLGGPGIVGFGGVPDALGVNRDTYWPRSAAAWIVLSLVLIFLSAQLVTPTRRWRFGRRRSGTVTALVPAVDGSEVAAVPGAAAMLPETDVAPAGPTPPPGSGASG